MENKKSVYVCGPLTELDSDIKEQTKKFYESIADLCEQILGTRAFVPHEHYDPVKHKDFTPQEVDQNERRQVCELSSALVVYTIAPLWGGGIEVEMANKANIPVILLCEKKIRKSLGFPYVKG